MSRTEKITSAIGARSEYFFWAAVVLLFFSFAHETPSLASSEGNASLGATGALASIKNPFDNLELTAEAAYVYDMRTGKALFAKNATTTLPLASVTKLMTASTALLLIPETTVITIDADAIGEEGDSGLVIGERWLLRELVTFMLLESSNDAAHAVASNVGAFSQGTEDLAAGRAFFIGEMNALAYTWGLSDTNFQNETGLDLTTTEPGAVSSARDGALLLARALERFPSIFSKTRWMELRLQNENGNMRPVRNTNKETDRIPLLIASKTGYTDLAGGNLVIAFDAGFDRPIIISVFRSTEEGRFEDAEKLVWATLEYLAQAR